MHEKGIPVAIIKAILPIINRRTDPLRIQLHVWTVNLYVTLQTFYLHNIKVFRAPSPWGTQDLVEMGYLSISLSLSLLYFIPTFPNGYLRLQKMGTFSALKNISEFCFKNCSQIIFIPLQVCLSLKVTFWLNKRNQMSLQGSGENFRAVTRILDCGCHQIHGICCFALSWHLPVSRFFCILWPTYSVKPAWRIYLITVVSAIFPFYIKGTVRHPKMAANQISMPL